MIYKVVRLYSVRDDVMLDTSDVFYTLFLADETDFQGYNLVLFPLTFKTDFLAEIDAARVVKKDMVVLDEQVDETDEVKGKHLECGDYFQGMKQVIEEAFPNKPAIWNQFGYNDYEGARRSQGRMIQFMEMCYTLPPIRIRSSLSLRDSHSRR